MGSEGGVTVTKRREDDRRKCPGPRSSQRVRTRVRLLESPEQYRMIAPLVIREIVCRLLSGEQAHRMRHLATVGGHAHRMVRAVNKLRDPPIRDIRALRGQTEEAA